MKLSNSNHLTDFDMMMIRAGGSVRDTQKVRRDTAKRKYLAQRKLCRVTASVLTQAARWLEEKEAAYAARADAAV